MNEPEEGHEGRRVTRSLAKKEKEKRTPVVEIDSDDFI